MFMYYERGNPRASASPEVFVVLDPDLGDRSTYKRRDEGKPPDLALEVISPSSEVRSREENKTLNARLGIPEHLLFQPDPKRPEQRLVGYRPWGGDYVEVKPDSKSQPRGALRGETLGISLRPDGARLRLRNLETNRDYPWL